MFDPTQHTLTDIRDAVAARRLSAVEVTRACLDRIDRLEPALHACNQVLHDQALARAADVDAGRITGPLAGVPIAIKDNICTTDGRTTCSSRMLENYRSPFNATVINRLLAAGAIPIAKTNLDEFAMGSSCENSAFGPTRNPWDPSRVPGGSSGGSAAAVAAAYAPVALGSDTGGSIRQPAALCGIVGMKPSYGLVSRYGLVAFASSLDQIGPFARNVTDAAAILNVIAGFDPLDSTSAPDAYSHHTDYLQNLNSPVPNLRIGIARQYASDANHPAVTAAVNQAIETYRSLGATIVEVDLPHTQYGIPTYYIVATAEASSNLARYDGVHFGHRAKNPADLVDLYAASRAQGFGPEVQRRIMLGTYALASGYYDAYYLRALKVRRLIANDFISAFQSCDAILCPTTTHPAFKLGEKTSDPLQMYLADVYTVNCNLAGIAGLTLPAGLTTIDNTTLPLSVQLLGPAYKDAQLLRIARMLEKALPPATLPKL
jgi:aspartyl-tRNA(Asn)/glutamyl-tRNA(Gln) amidotransferase subunit A